MANIKSAIKRARQNTKRRQHNASLRSRFRTHVKNVVKAIQTGNAENAQATFKAAQKIIDQAVSKGLIHKNKAARHKSRLTGHIQEIQQ